MDLGAFSVSLTVADLAASRAFYEALGFEHVMGDPAENWLILRNGVTTIGLFQGMFEGNLLTFNPGWTPNAEPLDEFEDVRSLQKAFKADGLEFLAEVDETTSGPGSFMLRDPDGNVILFDQHVG
ncbi:glyoxalase/bleomycin resistance protein/dioxygenase superfamily protein [Microterricola gilva]|uniref:Glyoxalase/bleomycin resistance protein/dioxygenase superfamily protein n=1 Tax=Microterricola gilva TaxID=393267 RepID=A0A4Q8ALZ1_9MICO|nr:VOC family protein [Microterricola gilva]RZU65574.1 glyoxalase/bleomycin resistance protein/dioxygenase superfamily protein [Microterricola gilva]